jgi:membrane protease YdiL (CAAX protease family)
MPDYLAPIIISAVYLALVFLRARLFKFFPRRMKRIVKEIYSCLGLRFNNIWSSVLLPVIFMNIIYLILLCAFGVKVIPPDNTFFEQAVSAAFIPFSEELIMRGLIFGFGFIVLPAYLFRLKNRSFPLFLRLVIISIGISFTSLFFVFQHQTVNYLRYFSSILFCLLYLYDKKNLVPAIIAHSTGNIIINFVTGC